MTGSGLVELFLPLLKPLIEAWEHVCLNARPAIGGHIFRRAIFQKTRITMSSVKIHDLCAFPTCQTLKAAMESAGLAPISVTWSFCKTFHEVLYRPELKAGRREHDYTVWKLAQS